MKGLIKILTYGIFKTTAIKNVVTMMMTAAVEKVIGMFIVAAIAMSGGIIGALPGGIIRAW